MCFEASTMEASTMKKKSSSFKKSSTQFLLSVDSTNSNINCCNNNAEKLELVEYDNLPEFLKHNEFILNYYRSEWPLKQTILSILSIHNETLNIWTVSSNADPLFRFSSSGNSSNTFYAHRANQTSTDPSPSSSQLPRWPFYIYLAGAMSCHCSKTSYIMLRLDFAGISISALLVLHLPTLSFALLVSH